MKAAFAPGETLPNFALPDHTKTERELSALQGDDPMLLVLVRGFFCSTDREQLKALTEFHPQLVAGCVRLAVITTDDWITTNALRQQLGAHYPFLFDDRRTVRDALDILEYTDAARKPMIPHTFLLAPGLKIHKVWNGYYYWGRPSTSELHQALRELTREIRPDWDLYAPGLKQKWDEGDKKAFYPYGSKSVEQAMLEMAGAVDQYA